MSFLKKQLSYWKTYLVVIEIILLLFFSSKIIGENGVSGSNFIITIALLSALFNTFFFIIFIIYDEDSFKGLNTIGKFLSIINFIYTSLVFTNTLDVGTHWIPALISTLFTAGLAMQFYIGLGSLSRVKRTWLFRLNSFLIIIVSFYGIFLFILQSEQGTFHNLFYYGIVLIFLLSIVSNIINLRYRDSKASVTPAAE
jgi:hypothetical protein